jgi:hypothetical protein
MKALALAIANMGERGDGKLYDGSLPAKALDRELDEIQAGVDKVFAERRAEYELLWGEPMKEERQ